MASGITAQGDGRCPPVGQVGEPNITLALLRHILGVTVWCGVLARPSLG